MIMEFEVYSFCLRIKRTGLDEVEEKSQEYLR